MISGRGSNMKALAETCRDDPSTGAEIAVVISNEPAAEGLHWAKDKGFATALVDHRAFDSRAGFEATLEKELDFYDVDLVCLAGFMRILGRDFTERWRDRLINIHPSLLPAYKGLRVHERVLADRCSESGCSVHFVRPEMDSGPVILQRRVPVLPGDTPESLAGRILIEEHIAYPEAVRLIAQNRVKIIDEQVEFI